MNIRIIVISALLFLFTGISLAQWDDSTTVEKKHHKHFPEAIFDRPAIKLNYGPTKENLNGFINSFEKNSVAEIKVGYSGQWESWFGKKILKYNYSYFTLGILSPDIDTRKRSKWYLQSNLTRFGFGKEEGYPIKVSIFGILPYTSSQIMWSYLDQKDYPDSSYLSDINLLSLYDKSYRFGSTFNCGISAQFTKLLSAQIEYERANIYRRHLFFMNSVSGLIEAAGNEIIDSFVGAVLRREPIAGSIVNFIFKGLYGYGMSQIRSGQMNWPFGGEPCLNYFMAKIGIGFTF